MYLTETLKRTVEKVTGRGKPTDRQARAAVRRRKPKPFRFKDDGLIPNNPELPVLLYPITVPVIIAGVRGTAALLQPVADLPMARAWLSMLVFFDVVFVTLSLWMFEPLMTE